MASQLPPIAELLASPKSKLPPINAPELLYGSDESDTSSDYADDAVSGCSVEYDDGAISISKVLDAIASSKAGDFATFNSTNRVNPGIFVPSLGQIDLPLTEAQALQLAAKCHQSPFGKGSQTVVDLSVRNTWELNADQFQIRNAMWDRYVLELTKKAVRELGVSNDDMIRPELYKMLLYGPGAHFHKHKDTEKANGMFATLVISLPSPHHGGDVILSHNKRTKIFSTSNVDQSYLCWYADVEHEVKPVVSGYRFVLTYNLIKPTSWAPTKKLVPESLTQQLNSGVKRWTKPDLFGVGPRKGLVYVLDHEYTEASLSFDALKGADLIKATALRNVCETHDVCLFLATLERRVENSIVDDDVWGYGYGHRGGYYDDEQCGCGESDCGDCCDGEVGGDADSVIEQISDEYILQKLVDPDGEAVAKDLRVEKEQILPPLTFADRDADDEDRQYTGNEGATSTLFYNVTAIVLMPLASLPSLRLRPWQQEVEEDGRYSSILYSTKHRDIPQKNAKFDNIFNPYLERWRADKDSRAAHSDLLSLCSWVVTEANFSNSAYSSCPMSWEHALGRVCSLLGELNEIQLSKQVICKMGNGLRPSFLASLKWLPRLHGWDNVKKAFDLAIDRFPTISDRLTALMSLLGGGVATLSGKNSTDIPAHWIKDKISNIFSNVTKPLESDAGLIVEVLTYANFDSEQMERIIQTVATNAYDIKFSLAFLDALRQSEIPQPLKTDLFTKMYPVVAKDIDFYPNRLLPMKGLIYVPSEQMVTIDTRQLGSITQQAFELGLTADVDLVLAKFEDVIKSFGQRDLEKALFPFLLSLIPLRESSFYQSLLERSRGVCKEALNLYLIKYVGEQPLKPTDWRQYSLPKCCNDCHWMSHFLENKDVKEGRFSAGGGRRKHLEMKVSSRWNDVSCRTDNQTHPCHTLVVTKHTKTYFDLYNAWEKRMEEANKNLEMLEEKASLEDLLGDGPEGFSADKLRKPLQPAKKGEPKSVRLVDSKNSYPIPPKNWQPQNTLPESVSTSWNRPAGFDPYAQRVPFAAVPGNAHPTAPSGVKRKTEVIDLTDDMPSVKRMR